MAQHTITIIPGDGVGPELSEAACRAIDATGVDIAWEVHNAGLAVMEAGGDPMPAAVIESIRRNKVALKGPLTTPLGTGIRSVNVALRRELDLFALVRPLKSYPGVRSRFADIDLVVVRENTEDLYAGIEFAVGEPGTLELIAVVERLNGRRIRADAGISLKPISIFGTERVFRFAFQWAVDNGRHMVTAVHKANIMKDTDGLWLRIAREISLEFPQIEFNDRIVDNMAMQLVQKPELYDVMVMPNLYGDILTDLGAGLVGGLGVAAGANFGDGVAMFEATHGSAPKYAGQNKANPMAMMFSGVLMLRHIGETDAADRLERAIAQVIAEGRSVTYDMKPERDDPTAVGTSQVADAVIEALGRPA
jgi:isocitrate dehydrogenase (NAD+)